MKTLGFTALSAVLVLSPAFAAPVPAPAPTMASPCPTQVLGDHDGDGDVDDSDVDIFTQLWLASDLGADWNFDCTVDFQDVVRFFDFYGMSCTWLDFNCDGVVNVLDAGDFTSQWLDEFTGAVNTRHTNITNLTDGDCVVNFLDLQVYLNAFNNCPWN